MHLREANADSIPKEILDLLSEQGIPLDIVVNQGTMETARAGELFLAPDPVSVPVPILYFAKNKVLLN